MASRPPHLHLQHACKQAGVDMRWLAEETGVPLDTLRKIVSGRRRPTLGTALRIAEALNLEVEDFTARGD
jgi:plasmid maintenance system antidote protein VapI